MKQEEIIDKVLVHLENNYGYDFSSDFWTDEILLVLRESIISSINVINGKDVKGFPCLHSEQICKSQCHACKFIEDGFTRVNESE
jgi:hypothetical protein